MQAYIPVGVPSRRIPDFLPINDDEEKTSWVAIPITPLPFLPNF